MRKVCRRTFLIASGALLAGPLASFAQQIQKVRLIGFLSPDLSDSPSGQQALRFFPEALSKLGYKTGENLAIEWRWSDGTTDDLLRLAEDLIRMKVEIIVARTNGPIMAAMKASKNIPIVMLNGNFPVEWKLIESLARPGGNVTGTSYITSSVWEKAIQILKELAPRTVRIAALWGPWALVPDAGRVPGSVEQLLQSSQQKAAAAVGATVQYFYVQQPEDIPAALNGIATSGSNAFFYSGHPIFRARGVEIMSFIRNRKLPAIATVPGFAEGGGLAHYAPDTSTFYDRTASYVDRLLKGAHPSNLPVEEPTKFQFVINLKTAKELGLTVPHSILVRADRVFE